LLSEAKKRVGSETAFSKAVMTKAKTEGVLTYPPKNLEIGAVENASAVTEMAVTKEGIENTHLEMGFWYLFNG